MSEPMQESGPDFLVGSDLGTACSTIVRGGCSTLPTSRSSSSLRIGRRVPNPLNMSASPCGPHGGAMRENPQHQRYHGGRATNSPPPASIFPRTHRAVFKQEGSMRRKKKLNLGAPPRLGG